MSDLRVTSERRGDVGILRAAGEARVELSDRVGAAAAGLLDAGCKHLVLDCSGLAFLDSASTGVLIHIQQRAREGGGRTALFGLQGIVARVLEVTGLSENFALFPDEAAALAHVEGA